ncbi:PQQ-dependent sugar dehydrogenase [Hydrogenophaga sp.]|uniref:PQQ-dependent sugar dehydrogenase n=1 Tax=Hydrogenophaga sp. TaxID=1904254 RepID=UPI0027191642|nr:PQQ-dependent sugar dehydrogenase [Hydrogenophaga sp.]MDO8904075.1 PQQ-dependent sugar dehydrogenase [Hydrogenophaga sp.]
MKYAAAFFMGALAAVMSAQAAGYRVETVASGLEHPWSLAFLPDGRMLVTERPGRLRLIEPGPDGRPQLRNEPVAGVPAVLARGQAGLFDVALHPDHAVNGQVLLSFAHGSPEANHLRVVRARFDGHQLLDVQPVFTTQPAKAETQHFGGRMAWLPDGSLLLGMGDGNLDRTDAQRLHTHLGKILRIKADGSVPDDNPFLARPDARPEIYTFGHRNPQGLVVVNGVPFAHEHGARGGDELNLLQPGANYGWPVTTGGIDYTYARITPYRSLPGMEPPLVEWTPSIAPAGLAWYDGALFPAWRGSLFVAALVERSVRRVPLSGRSPGSQEVLFQELGERIRDVRAGPEGAIYLLTDSPNGRVLRVTPASP